MAGSMAPETGARVKAAASDRPHAQATSESSAASARPLRWCGHTQEIIPFPRVDGSVLFIDVIGEAS
jgi:hypothetical protein